MKRAIHRLCVPVLLGVSVGWYAVPADADDAGLTLDVEMSVDVGQGGVPVTATARADGFWVTLETTGAVQISDAGQGGVIASISAAYAPRTQYFVSAYAAAYDAEGNLVDERDSGDSLVTRGVPADFEGDWHTHMSVRRGAWWYVLRTGSDKSFYGFLFGRPEDVAAPGYYDDDEITDVAVFRVKNGDGRWWIQQSTGGERVEPFGQAGDVPVVADYDGDRITDLAVRRGVKWLVLPSSGLPEYRVAWGLPDDRPVPADYNGDGAAEIAVWRPTTGEWWIRSGGGTAPVRQWGAAGDRPVAGDFDGDARDDIAVWRPTTGEWWILGSRVGPRVRTLGAPGDTPVPGDYDADGITDVAVFRANPPGRWSILYSGGGGREVDFGFATDQPIPAAR